MLSPCGCLCAPAGHYGVCQVTAKPGLRHITNPLTVTPRAEVCEACHRAAVEARLRPAAAATPAVMSRAARG